MNTDNPFTKSDPALQETIAAFDRARAGDREALELAFERMRPRLEKWIALRLGSHLKHRLDVEDLVQETLTHAFLSLPDFNPTHPRAVFRWLYQVAENRIRDGYDKVTAAKRNPERERELHSRLEASWTSPSMNAARREDHERLLELLGRLADNHREIIRLVRIEELSYAEAGERLGISTKNASVRLVRALKAMRELSGANSD